MDEYAIRFYSLVSQSVKLDAAERREQALIAVLPNAKKGEYERIMKQFENFSEDPIERFLINRPDNKKSGVDKLKGLLGG